MKMFGLKMLRTTGYNPRANGLTEKGNAFIKNYLDSDEISGAGKFCMRITAVYVRPLASLLQN